MAEHGPDAMTWSMFETFMHDQYGQLQTATEIRAAYDEMHQSDFDSVSSFVRAFRIKERELIGTPYHPGGGAIIDFIKKLTPAVRRYVQDNAPEKWWTDVKQVYCKALNYQLNQHAAVQVSGHLSDCGLASDPDSNSHSEPDDDDLLEQNQHSGQKRKRVPDADWEARRDSASCYRCGEPGHIARECQAEL